MFVAPAIVGFIGLTGTAALVGQAVIGVGLSLGASYLAKRLAPKPKASNGAQNMSLSLRLESNDDREIGFGTFASAGSLKYQNTYGPNGNDFVQLVYQVADHQCDSLVGVKADGVDLTLGSVTSGSLFANGTTVAEFPGVMWIEFHDGSWDQDADADLVAHGTSWTTNERGRGCAYVRVTMKFDAAKFANGMPRFRFVVKGIPLYDWRLDDTVGGDGDHRWGDEDTYEWTDNPVVCAYNYRRGIFVNGQRLGGMSTPTTSLPLAHWTSGANACDEDVNLKGGGSEKRYRCGGLISVKSEHASVLREFVTAWAGVEIDTGGVFRPLVGVSQASVMTIADTDLWSSEAIEVIPKLPRSMLQNAVFGSFQDPSQMFEEVALPPRISPEDEATDGTQLSNDYGLGMVQSGTQGQRILEILRRRGRFQRKVTCRLRSRFAVLESGDWVTWTSARYGWVSMVFEVIQATLDRNMTVMVELREVSTSIFAWTPAVDELDPNDPATVGAGGSTFTTVQGFDVQAVVVDGTPPLTHPGLRATWTPIDDPTVTRLKLEYRKVGDTIALERLILDPGAGEYTWLDGIQEDVNYEARVVPVTVPERTVSFTGWVAADDPTPAHIVGIAAIATAVPPDTITPDMLSPQARFELSLVTASADVVGSVQQKLSALLEAAQQAGEAALEGITSSDENLIRVVSLTQEVGTMGARWGVAIVMDGLEPRVLGLVSIDGTLDGSTFSVVADAFTIAQPGEDGGDPIPVFTLAEVDGVLKLALRADMIVDGSILARHLSVLTLSAITADIGEVTAGLLRSSDNKFRIDLDGKTLEIVP